MEFETNNTLVGQGNEAGPYDDVVEKDNIDTTDNNLISSELQQQEQENQLSAIGLNQLPSSLASSIEKMTDHGIRTATLVPIPARAPEILFPAEQGQRLYWDRSHYDSPASQLQALHKSSTLYVGNLAFTTRTGHVRSHFSPLGPILKIVMGLDRHRKTPCGFCFVQYYHRIHALLAVAQLSGTKLDGRIIRVELDAGFQPGRQYGRGVSGGQVRDDRRQQQQQQRLPYQQQQQPQQQRTSGQKRSLVENDQASNRPRLGEALPSARKSPSAGTAYHGPTSGSGSGGGDGESTGVSVDGNNDVAGTNNNNHNNNNQTEDKNENDIVKQENENDTIMDNNDDDRPIKRQRML